MDYQQSVMNFLKEAREAAERFLDGLSDPVIEAYCSMSPEEIGRVFLSDSEVIKRDEKQAIKAYLAARAIRAAVALKANLPKINVLAMEPWHLADTMLRLGMSYQELIAMETRLSKNYQGMIYSMEGGRRTSIGRGYYEDREDYAAAIQEASESWENGGTDQHHIVAKKLAKRYKLNENGLKKKLAPIAREYGRCSGMKGVKKAR
jgi:hypothetical protein